MTIQIQPGITLTVIPTEEYKTIRLFARFSAKHTRQEAASRTLLTSCFRNEQFKLSNTNRIKCQVGRFIWCKFWFKCWKTR